MICFKDAAHLTDNLKAMEKMGSELQKSIAKLRESITEIKGKMATFTWQISLLLAICLTGCGSVST